MRLLGFSCLSHASNMHACMSMTLCLNSIIDTSNMELIMLVIGYIMGRFGNITVNMSLFILF